MIITNPFSSQTWSRDQINAVSSGWWVLLANGIVSLVAGSIILFTRWTIGDLAVFVGALLLFGGVFRTFSVPIDGSARAWSIVLGLLEAAVGLAVWTWPGPTLLVIAFLIGWYVLFSGIMTIAGSIGGRDFLPFWGLMLVFGVVEVGLSFWLLSRPALTLVAAALAIGLWAGVSGVMQIALSFEIKNLRNRVGAARRELNATVTGRAYDAAAN